MEKEIFGCSVSLSGVLNILRERHPRLDSGIKGSSWVKKLKREAAAVRFGSAETLSEAVAGREDAGSRG
ncbi:hypothetical protein PQQ86_15740 [Paraburkholderia sediminicola]|uniref:hypothetical protein n=1 Tax=Paraburkholderia sediminicola TaxID=458836 RepID=UPI0038BDA27E